MSTNAVAGAALAAAAVLAGAFVFVCAKPERR